jgi:hypothetical protein
MIGSWIILIGIISLFITMYMFPPAGLAGSNDSPYMATQIQSDTFMMTMSTNINITQEYYVETNSLTFATQSASSDIMPMTFKKNTHYQRSYIYRDILTPSEYVSLVGREDIVGIWEIPEIVMVDSYQNINQDVFGTMDDALNYSRVTELIDMGYSGQNTITVVIDGFPSQSEFYSFFPSVWSDRVLIYPSSFSGSMHGVMTTGVVAGVSPDTSLYLIDISEYDILAMYQKVIELKTVYPNYDIVCTNSYVFTGTPYYDASHPVNRKIVEMTENDIAVLFGAGNWAHPGDHNPSWMLNAGYDSRNGGYGSDDQIGYPSVSNKIICVAGCNAYCDKILSYSSIGRGIGNNNKPDVCAPTHFYYSFSPYDGIASGTSTSTPFMAGLVANILSGKTFEVDRLIGSIQSYSIDKGLSGFDTSFGYGIVDAVNIFNNYDLWVKPINQSMDLSMYIVSLSFLGFGIVVYNKNKFEKILGG